MEQHETTVADLIAKLQQFPPAATVGVKAACCVYTHELDLHDVRLADPNERLERTGVIIEIH